MKKLSLFISILVPLFIFCQPCNDMYACNFGADMPCEYASCTVSPVLVSGCKIEDNDCNGIFSDGDNYLSNWIINWDNGYEMGYVTTGDDGCYTMSVPIPDDFNGVITIFENMQDGYTPFGGEDGEEGVQYIQVDPLGASYDQLNFFNWILVITM